LDRRCPLTLDDEGVSINRERGTGLDVCGGPLPSAGGGVQMSDWENLEGMFLILCIECVRERRRVSFEPAR